MEQTNPPLVPLLSSFRRLTWLWLPVLLVLLARVAVAPGWMVERAEGGTLTVRICSDVNGAGQSIEIPFERSADHAAGDQHCPWGALAGAAPLPEFAPPGAVSTTALPVPVPLPVLGFAPGIASPLPPSTGPPIFA